MGFGGLDDERASGLELLGSLGLHRERASGLELSKYGVWGFNDWGEWPTKKALWLWSLSL